MIDLETKMTALEMQWRAADDLLRAARAEVVANEQEPAAVISAIRKRIERAEQAKQMIMNKIAALEDEIDASG